MFDEAESGRNIYEEEEAGTRFEYEFRMIISKFL